MKLQIEIALEHYFTRMNALRGISMSSTDDLERRVHRLEERFETFLTLLADSRVVTPSRTLLPQSDVALDRLRGCVPAADDDVSAAWDEEGFLNELSLSIKAAWDERPLGLDELLELIDRVAKRHMCQ